MDSLAIETIEATFLVDACKITKPRVDGRGTLDRDTGKMTYPEPSIVYEGPCHIVDNPGINRQIGGVTPQTLDDHVLRIRACKRSDLRAGMNVHIRYKNATEWQQFEIDRLPERSLSMATHMVIRRATASVTSG